MTFSPTFEMYELIQKISDGDVFAVRDLWPLMFDEPFDPSRPLADITADIVAKFDAYNEANKVEEKPAQPEPLEDPLGDWLALLVKIMTAPRTPKK